MPDNSNVSVAVLLPCYNEEVTIGKVVRDFKAALPNADIYVYDNNSTDHTAEIATSEGAIVRKEPRQGKGNEVETEMTIHSLNNNLRLFEMPIQYRDRPAGSVSKLDTVGDGIKVMSTIFRMIREYKPLPFFGGLGAILGIIGIVLCGSVTVDFWHTGMVARFPTLIGAVMLVIAGLLLFITGIILDVMAKNDRKAFIIDANQFAMMRRQK